MSCLIRILEYGENQMSWGEPYSLRLNKDDNIQERLAQTNA